MSKKFLDVIPFDRIICVKDISQGEKRFIEVILEERQSITVHPQEVDDFMESFKAFIQISEAINLGIIPDDKEKIRSKRPDPLPLSSDGIKRRP
jgi:hypothetical protein